MNKHLFALYVPELQKHIELNKKYIRIKDKDLFHRIAHVLRIQKDESVHLFDRQHNTIAKLKDFEKKDTVIFSFDAMQTNKTYSPTLQVVLPVLKKDALEQAVNNATQLGANHIQLVTTEKTQRKWHGAKELERLEKIIIAAAEQSKNFCFPLISEPVALNFVCARYKNAHRFFADPHGQHILHILNELDTELHTPELVLLVGPEGDLSLEEKKELKQADFRFVRLTPTILRAEQAAALLIGIFRALL